MHLQQTGEYATDEEDTGTAVDGGDKSIEVFDLPESEDILSPSELDATKLYQKFREVMLTCENQGDFKRNPRKVILPQGRKKPTTYNSNKTATESGSTASLGFSVKI